MKPLSNVKSVRESNGDIVIRWDPAAVGNDRYISFYELVNASAEAMLCPRRRIDLKQEGGSASITMKSPVLISGVHKITYVAFSHDEKIIGEEAIRRACSLQKEYYVVVMDGQADVSYELRKKDMSDSTVVTMVFDCTSPIEAEMLGYRYTCGVQILQPVPALPQGKTELPPIIVPKDTPVEIIPFRAEFSQNLLLREKKKKLFGLL